MLTIVQLKLKTKCFTKSSRNQFDLERLKDPKIVEVFQAKFGGKVGAFCILDSDRILAKSLKKKVLFSTAEKDFGRQRKKTQPWVTKRFWICAIRDGSRNNRSTQALKQDQSTEK